VFSEQSQTLSGLPRPSDPTALAQALLSVNVLDPSMGSGHFLVEATDFIARALVELGLPPPADAAGESDLAYWRRRVAQNCIYGVDVNPLAVELAKLSLWLTTVARGKPLSFLDHHLRCGNSLIGARVADLPLAVETGRRPVSTKRPNKKQQQAEAAARAAGQLSMLDDRPLPARCAPPPVL
jgi:type II restriction/modification system DNA methylase subunit YeeA